MSKLAEIKERMTTVNAQLAALKEELPSLFDTGLKELFAKHPTVTGLSVRINNHEFNDGDATYFGFYYEDLTLEVNGEEFEGDSYSAKEESETEKIRQEFVKFFEDFDTNGFYEHRHSDEYESVSFAP
jgi:hypothetical protein